MIPDQTAIYRELANYLRSEGIASCVLHGIDPVTGTIGRDLDLYIPDSSQAYRVAGRFSEILKAYGVKWVSLMHPIWGPRCIGVRESDYAYWELHILTSLKMACIDFGGIFPIEGKEEAHGFNFDPSLWFIKAVLMKYSHKFMHNLPTWANISGDTYVLNYRAEIERSFQKHWRNGANFVTAVLAPDTDTILCARRKELKVMLRTYLFAHPCKAARAVARWLYRKVSIYYSQTVPVIGIETAVDSDGLQSCLADKLGHVFMEIVVTDQRVPLRTWQRLQARQSLLVYRGRPGQINVCKVDTWVKIPTANQESVDEIAAAILDAVVQYNERWSAIYRVRLRAR